MSPEIGGSWFSARPSDCRVVSSVPKIFVGSSGDPRCRAREKVVHDTKQRSRARTRVLLFAAIASSVWLVMCAPHRGHSKPGDPGAKPEAEQASIRDARSRAGSIPPFDERHPSPRSAVASSGVNVRVNQDSSGQDQTENVIAVNPLDPLNLVAGANDKRTGTIKCGHYSSADGGHTWTDGVLSQNLSLYPLQGDPALAFCADGSVVYACLGYTSDAPQGRTGAFSYVSNDGGVSWDGPHTVIAREQGLPDYPFVDKQWVACDRTADSPYNNRMYVSWTEVLRDDWSGVITVRSSDDGVSWSDSTRVSSGSLNQGTVVAVGPDGVVNVAWHDNIWAENSRIGFDRSTDGGETFGEDRFPAAVVWIKPPHWGGTGPELRWDVFPTLDVDRSDGPDRGNLYIAWSDDRHGDPDILLTRSTDGGTSWSSPIRVNDDPMGSGADQFYPWIAVDPEGRVIVAFFDRRRFPGQRPYEIWGAVSRDGGRSFDTNFLISDTPGRPDEEIGFIGDFFGLTATSDRLYPFWTDVRAEIETDAYVDLHPNTFSYDEVRGVRWLDADTLDFESQDQRFGEDLDYDVIDGILSELRVDAGFIRSTCAAAVWPGPPYVDSRTPPARDGYYFLVRARGSSGVGSYGDGSPARPNVRDTLNQGASPCP